MHKNEEYRLKTSILKKDNEQYIKELELCGINKTIVNELKNIEGDHTLKTSILSQYENIEHVSLDYFLCSWLEDSINIFESFKYAINQNIANSINPKKMVKVEINKLNHFFETGVYESNAYHSRLITGQLYELYSSLLYGEPWVLISMDELLGFEGILNNQDIAHKAEFFKENMQNNLKLEWWLSIRLQVLLWLNDYLEGLNKSKNFTDIFLKHKRKKTFDDLVAINQGFQVKNPDKTIPALHKVLIKNNLIAKISEEDFDKAIQNGVGTIDWKGTQRQLGGFVNELVNNYAYQYNKRKWIVAAGIFLVKGKLKNANDIKGGNAGKTNKDTDLIDDIFGEIAMS